MGGKEKVALSRLVSLVILDLSKISKLSLISCLFLVGFHFCGIFFLTIGVVRH